MRQSTSEVAWSGSSSEAFEYKYLKWSRLDKVLEGK